ncbi:MAG: hypothetical protein AB7H80_06390 [Candidatus Kapaibacterium sp.]
MQILEDMIGSHQLQMKRRENSEGILHNLVECRKCATVGYAGEAYCVCCGSQMNDPKPKRACPHCSEEILHSVANYCPHCGKKVESSLSL